MYKFRIKFILSESTYFGVDENSLLINLPSRSYVLSSHGDKKISESSVLILSGTGFNTETEAYLSGKHLMDVLRICSIRMGIGINLGNNENSGGLTEYYRDLIFQETGNLILNEINGLMVFEDTANTKVASVSANGILTKDINPFKEEFQQLHDSSIFLPEKLVYAFEFFNLTQFNSPPRIKFLLYIITIESLIEARARRSDVVNHVNNLINLTKENTSLEHVEKQSLISSLNYLKNESISASGRNLVSEYLAEKSYNGNQANKFFTDCYNIRSKLVHNGKWKVEYESVTYELGNMVKDLLLRIVETDCIKL